MSLLETLYVFLQDGHYGAFAMGEQFCQPIKESRKGRNVAGKCGPFQMVG